LAAGERSRRIGDIWQPGNTKSADMEHLSARGHEIRPLRNMDLAFREHGRMIGNMDLACREHGLGL
jgi:nitroreductase